MQQRYNLTDGDDTLNFVMPYWGFYVEDKWQLNPKWTLSAGMRYDLGIQTYSGNQLWQRHRRHELRRMAARHSRPRRRPRSPLPAGGQEQLRASRERGVRARVPAGCSAAATASSTTLASRPPGCRDLAMGSAACLATSATSYYNSRFDVPDDVPVMSLTTSSPRRPPSKSARIRSAPAKAPATSTMRPACATWTSESGDTPYFHRFVALHRKADRSAHGRLGLLHGQPRTRSAVLRQPEHPGIPDGLELGRRAQRRAAEQQRPICRCARAATRPDIHL